MPQIVLIRHAESAANAAGMWNGRMDGPLSDRGLATLDPLGKRLTNQEFDVVISSPLSRARLTAESFASDIEIDERFIEIDLGEWEGASREEILTSDGDYLREAIAGRRLRMGRTGETLVEVAHRAIDAIDALATKLGEEERAAVVTHGGFLQAVLQRHLAGHGRRVHSYVANTSISKLTWSWDRPRLAVFNDVGHLGPRPATVEDHLAAGEPVLTLIRHGQTRANTEQRWQGQGDWGLDEVGHQQALALRDWYGTADTVYSSPLGRAFTTAGYLARNGVVAVDGLQEIGMGEWEGMTSEEIMRRWPDQMETIYRDGVDLRRGGNGESWGELTWRFRNTVHGVSTSTEEPTLVVAHGGAIRAYVSSLTTTGDTHAESLFTPANTSITHVALTASGPLLLDYAVATHLEALS